MQILSTEKPQLEDQGELSHQRNQNIITSRMQKKVQRKVSAIAKVAAGFQHTTVKLVNVVGSLHADLC